MRTTFQLSEPCGTRPIRFLQLLEIRDWRIKVYGITYGRPLPREDRVRAGLALAETAFPPQALGQGRHGVGFLGIHDGRGATFIFADWWADENELHHRVFVSPHPSPDGLFSPDSLEERTGTGLTACVWDLRVQCFERQAWLETVLRGPDGPDLEAYLARRLNEDA